MFKALKSFCGKVSMKKGETKDINDKDIIKDLLNAGYIEEIKEESKKYYTKLEKEIKDTEEKIEKTKEKIEEKVKKTNTSKKKK